MTRVLIKKKNGNIVSVNCSGHTGFASEGEDIVCAALSSIVQTALLGLLSLVGLNVKIDRNDEDGILKFSLPEALNEKESYESQIILKTMLLGIADLSENWGKYIRLDIKEN